MFWIVYFLNALRVLVVILAVDTVGQSTKNTSAGLLGSSPSDTISPKYYVVRPGDSLYTIGFSYGIGYQKLAEWNGLSPPYRIKAGERIRINQLNQSVIEASEMTAKDGVSDKKLIEVTKKSINSIEDGKMLKIYFNWPIAGKVIKEFSSDDHHGINIAAQFGAPVRASSAGTVVYSGDGISGYGNLLIIKHGETFMSAYANNRRLLVREADQVEQGQTIAEIGSVDNQAQLHFEIRKNGAPVDPLGYLPAH
jgi:lipoprotein NlpD